jgi:TPR repeat protein
MHKNVEIEGSLIYTSIMRTLPVYRTILIMIYCFALPLVSQQERQSKAFRAKSSAFRILEVRQSDVTYQLWEGFQLMRNANAGDAPSQHELSIRYLTGRGFSHDTVKAAVWMKKSADQNYILAKFNYGIYLNNGWGVEWNPFAAFTYIEYAAKKEMREAQYVMGLFYTDNLIVQRNYPLHTRGSKNLLTRDMNRRRMFLLSLRSEGSM